MPILNLKRLTGFSNSSMLLPLLLLSLSLKPRTEIRIRGLAYSSGAWQFEGHGFVPNGTSGTIVAQIHGAAYGATTLILRIYDGDMRYYSQDVVATGLYNKWFRLNVIHDVVGGTVCAVVTMWLFPLLRMKG